MGNVLLAVEKDLMQAQGENGRRRNEAKRNGDGAP